MEGNTRENPPKRYGNPLEVLKREGLSNRAYNVLMRSGYTTVEDLIGTDPDEMIIAEGPEPPNVRKAVIYTRDGQVARHSSEGRRVVGFHRAYYDWESYRYRPAWSDLYNLGIGTVQNIEDALAQWKARCRQSKSSCIIEVEESESSVTLT